MSDLFLLNAGLFPFSLSEISEILVSPSICTKIRTWRFHRTEEVSNDFSVSWHITHISMAISANLGRDTDHNSAKLVCSHPLGGTFPLLFFPFFLSFFLSFPVAMTLLTIYDSICYRSCSHRNKLGDEDPIESKMGRPHGSATCIWHHQVTAFSLSLCC